MFHPAKCTCARNRSLFLASVLLVTLLVSVAAPADAYNYTWRCRGENTTFNSDSVTFQPFTGSFPVGSAWRNSLESARSGWNFNTPSSEFRFNFTYVGDTVSSPTDGRNQILISNDFDFTNDDGGITLAVTLKRRNKSCPWWPLSRPRIAEADILFNPNPGIFRWENATNPALPLFILDVNSTLVALHEMGHAFGLAHEDNIMGTMDALYPDGGPLGNGNQVHPHADDVLGNLGGYGWTPLFGPWQRDVAASAFRRSGAGTSEEIPAPATLDRGVSRAMQFTVENRSLYDQNGVRVQFYLSTNRFISTGDRLLGATTLNMPGMFTGTLTANVTVPTSVPPGQYFFGYIVDVNGQIAEVNEGNNGVGYSRPSTVTNNNIPPTACFTASPSFGSAPLVPFFNAACSSDPDGTITSYTWDMGNGAIRTGQSFNFFYSEPGFYRVILTVRDNSGATRTTSQIIEVFGDCDDDPTQFCDPI